MSMISPATAQHQRHQASKKCQCRFGDRRQLAAAGERVGLAAEVRIGGVAKIIIDALAAAELGDVADVQRMDIQGARAGEREMIGGVEGEAAPGEIAVVAIKADATILADGREEMTDAAGEAERCIAGLP